MRRLKALKQARGDLAQAEKRSKQDDWLGTDQFLTRARLRLERADRDDLAKRLNHARGVGATSSGARKEIREVMQLINADDAVRKSVGDGTGTTSAFQITETLQ